MLGDFKVSKSPYKISLFLLLLNLGSWIVPSSTGVPSSTSFTLGTSTFAFFYPLYSQGLVITYNLSILLSIPGAILF
jgi:hypothetical protein